MEITDFLTTRYAERAAEAPTIHALGCDALSPCPDGCCPMGTCDCGEPERALAELAAKQKRLALYLKAKQFLEGVLKSTRAAALAEETPADFHTHVRERRNVQQAAGRFVAFDIAVRLDAMAQPEHPDYDPAWRIDA